MRPTNKEPSWGTLGKEKVAEGEWVCCFLVFKSYSILWARAKASSVVAISTSRSLVTFLWKRAWAADQRYSNKKERLNLASMRFYTTPLHSRSPSSDKESSEVLFKETNTGQRSSIKMFPKNAPPLNPLVKSLWTLNNPSKSGKSSAGTENQRKLA